MAPTDIRSDADRPDVAVIVPSYNGARHVAAALASIRDSVFPSGDVRMEVLVVDSGSYDGTPEVVEAIMTSDRRFRLLRPSVHLNAPQARNVALADVRAPVVACLDHDDLTLQNRLDLHLRALLAEPALAAVGGQLIHMDATGVELQHNGSEPVIGVETARFVLPVLCPTLTSAMTYRTSALRAVGGFFEHRPYADDYHLFAALFDHGGVRMLAEPAARYRTHESQLSARSRPEQHLEVVRLRQRIAEAVLGETPTIDVVWAWRAPGSARPDTLERAIEQFDRYHDRFIDRFSPASDERDSITRFCDRRIQQMHQALDAARSVA